MDKPEYKILGYEILGRKVEPIICVYCNCCGLDSVHSFEDLGFCISCKSYYRYDPNGFPSPQIEVQIKEE